MADLNLDELGQHLEESDKYSSLVAVSVETFSELLRRARRLERIEAAAREVLDGFDDADYGQSCRETLRVALERE